MATNPKVVAADETEGAAKGRTRSPAYPFINLETAIKRAQEFYDHQLRNAASRVVAVKHWGYQEKSSGGLQTIAALIAFGLMQDEGTGEKRKLKLTLKAIRLLLDKRPDSPDRAQLIKEMALTPKIHRDLWEKWGSSLPLEQVRYTLTAEWEPPFNEKTVDGFIQEYRDTIAFAKLSESDKVTSEDGGSAGANGSYVPQVGDYVQWESQGILQFREPVRVRDISPDGQYAFVDGSQGGIPVAQLILEAKPAGAKVEIIELRSPLSPNTHMQEFVVPLSDQRRAVFQWPSSLTEDDIADLKDSLKIVERKIARSATQASEEKNP